jgi:hypothetical protein
MEYDGMIMSFKFLHHHAVWGWERACHLFDASMQVPTVADPFFF